MKNINKIASLATLLLSGWVLSFLFGNFIITTLGCLLLGVMLNRKSRPSVRAGTKTEWTESLRCQRCGTTIGSDQKYCEKCGTEITLPSLPTSRISERYSPKQVEEWLRETAEKDKTSYEYVLYDLLLIGERGDCWSIDAESSRWCRYEKDRWIPDEPTGTLQLTRRSDVSPEVTIPAIVAEKGKAQTRIICSFCKAEVGPTDQFCINCGRKLTPRVD